MDAKDIKGLLMAAIAYGIVGGLGTVAVYFIGRLFCKSPEAIRNLGLVLGILFVLGFATWMYLVRDLQRAF